MQVTFTVPAAIVKELNQIAVKAGFEDAKLMTMAYLKATIKASRENAIRDATPETSVDDVVIS